MIVSDLVIGMCDSEAVSVGKLGGGSRYDAALGGAQNHVAGAQRRHQTESVSRNCLHGRTRRPKYDGGMRVCFGNFIRMNVKGIINENGQPLHLQTHVTHSLGLRASDFRDDFAATGTGIAENVATLTAVAATHTSAREQ